MEKTPGCPPTPDSGRNKKKKKKKKKKIVQKSFSLYSRDNSRQSFYSASSFSSSFFFYVFVINCWILCSFLCVATVVQTPLFILHHFPPPFFLFMAVYRSGCQEIVSKNNQKKKKKSPPVSYPLKVHCRLAVSVLSVLLQSILIFIRAFRYFFSCTARVHRRSHKAFCSHILGYFS